MIDNIRKLQTRRPDRNGNQENIEIYSHIRNIYPLPVATPIGYGPSSGGSSIATRSVAERKQFLFSAIWIFYILAKR